MGTQRTDLPVDRSVMPVGLRGTGQKPLAALVRDLKASGLIVDSPPSVSKVTLEATRKAERARIQEEKRLARIATEELLRARKAERLCTIEENRTARIGARLARHESLQAQAAERARAGAEKRAARIAMSIAAQEVLRAKKFERMRRQEEKRLARIAARTQQRDQRAYRDERVLRMLETRVSPSLWTEEIRAAIQSPERQHP